MNIRLIKILVTSNRHLAPLDQDTRTKEQKDKLKKHIKYLDDQLKDGSHIVLAGDIFDTLEFDRRSYEGHLVLKNIKEWKEK